MEEYKKFEEIINIEDFQVLTDKGFVDIKSVGKTIPYTVYELKTKDGNILKCADNHIIFDENFNEIFVKNIKVGEKIITDKGITTITEIKNLGYEENMYDLELCENSDHRYYTNNILSHNTLMAKTLAKEIFGDEKYLVRFDMSEYSDKTSVNKLIGSSAGYVGYQEGGLLTEAIKNKKHCVLLIDEIEKADEQIYNLFLQILDDGFLTDNTGNKVDFTNTIILLTSNVGTRQASETRSIGFDNNDNVNKKDIIEKELKKKFPPEFINRLSNVVYFNSLTEDNLKKIIQIELEKLNKRLNDIKYILKYSNDVIDYIINYIKKDIEYGARPILRAIQELIENKITDLLLENDYKEWYEFNIDIKNNEIKVK